MKKSVVILLHTGYWLSYLLLLLLIVLCLNAGVHLKISVLFSHPGMNIFFGVFAFVPALTGFYVYYSLLFNRFLNRKKIALFFLAATGTSVFAGMFGAAILDMLFRSHIGPGIFNDGFKSAVPIAIIMTIIALLNGVVGLVMKGFITWYGDIKLKEDLASKNHATELALVKSQIDPHFLFNTLNNIDVMIEMDAAKASAYLNKLSGIMRFMLYETKTERIPLQKEIDYIRQYISLQQIRVANPGYVQFSVEGNVEAVMVHAMIFIPFIENAFKHNSDNVQDGAIRISFWVESGSIIFTCKNTCSVDAVKKVENGGIGNQLIQKRLTLLYGPKHTLHTNHQPGNYTVNLRIQTV